MSRRLRLRRPPAAGAHPPSSRPGSRTRWVRIGGAVVIAVAVCSLAVGCVHSTAPTDPPPGAQAFVPTPPGASTDVPRDPSPDAQTCDTSSLAPRAQTEPGQMPPGSTMDAIARRGRIIVGLDVGSNPFSFRDPITGEIQGFDVDIAREIAAAIFGSPGHIEYRVLSSEERTEALRSGEVDAVVKTMSITCDRLHQVSFSVPYYIASQRILVLRNSGVTDVAGLAGKRVCAARGATSVGRLQQAQPAAKLVTTTTWADCLVMLQQGQVDAVSTDDAILAGLAAQDPWTRVVGPSLGQESYGVGLPQGHDDMVRFVNGVLATITADGRWQQIHARWLSILGPGYGPPPAVYRD